MRHFIIVGVLVLVMSVLVFFGLDATGILPASASAQAETIDWLFNLELIAISFLFSLIIVPLVYSLVVFRRRKGEEGEGEHMLGNTKLEIAWTVIPLIIVLALAYLGAWSLGEALAVDPEAMKVEVTAFQWNWKFYYPEQGITTTELYLPLDKQVLLEMESQDVIHSFWVPEFRLKQDIVPGQVTELRLTPTEEGHYMTRCAELCGTSHAYMVAPVVVVTQDEFSNWIDEQIALIPDDPGPNADRGELIAGQNGCQACHSFDGSNLVGPTWLGLYGSEVELDDGSVVTADDAFISDSILEPNAQIVAGYPANAMPTYSLSEAEIADIIEFIKSISQ
ncbi:MAG TPA: cytochrome c oxidase subunit II [Anaerolineales bacterium]|nr:cytochrome c oxidase subunit II [Anaerolineales bacterium]